MLKTAGGGAGGGGSGTVTQVSTGTGLTGGPITVNGTISLANTAVTAGVYGNATSVSQVTVNAQGQITNAVNVAISIANSAVTGLGTMSIQNANAVAVTGGVLDNVTIGATTKNTGAFTTILGGNATSFTSFPNTKSYISQASTGDTHPYNTGVVGEALASATDTAVWGVGVYGVGSTNGATRSAGVQGDGHVNSTSDSGSAIGVRGYALQTHAGGFNIGLYGDATGSGTGNYALYMNQGGIYNANVVTWTMNGNVTFAGAYSVTIPNVSSSNATITGGAINVQTTNLTAATSANATFATSSLPLVPAGYINVDLNGTVVKVPYYAV